MNARWRVRPHDATRILELSRGSGLSPLLAQLLLNRGIDDPKRAISFLEAQMGSLHDPETLARGGRGGRPDSSSDGPGP